MSTELTTTNETALASYSDAAERYRTLAEANAALSLDARFAEWLGGMTDRTAAAYRGDLLRFANWHRLPGQSGPDGETAQAKAHRETVRIAAGLRLLVDAGNLDPLPMPTLRMIERYRDEMMARGLKSSTVGRAIAVINSALRMLAKVGIGPNAQEVDAPASNVVKGSRAGPRQQTVSAMLQRLENGTDAANIRDAAIVSLLARCALRRGEVVTLDVEHFDPSQCRVHIMGKGRKVREWMAINAATCSAISAWLDIHSQHAAPGSAALFVGLGNRARGQRITGETVRLIVQRAADGIARKGDAVRPHGLRHTAASVIIKASNGNMALAQHALRHSNIATTSKAYDDTAEQSQRSAIELLGTMI